MRRNLETFRIFELPAIYFGGNVPRVRLAMRDALIGQLYIIGVLYVAKSLIEICDVSFGFLFLPVPRCPRARARICKLDPRQTVRLAMTSDAHVTHLGNSPGRQCRDAAVVASNDHCKTKRSRSILNGRARRVVALEIYFDAPSAFSGPLV